MRFSSFCFRMANKIILREIKKTCQPFQCDVYLSDWTLEKESGVVEFDLIITGCSAKVSLECIRLVEKYANARINAFCNKKAVRLL